MEVASYIFQSPYNSQVQIGQPDPSAKSNSQAENQNAELIQKSNTKLQEAQTFQSTQKSEVTPTIKESSGLDLYA